MVENPLFFLLHDEPNTEMTSFVFRETLMTHLLLWGNAYAQIIRNGKGKVVRLYPLMPDRMTVNRNEKGRLYYEYMVSSDDAKTLKEKIAKKCKIEKPKNKAEDLFSRLDLVKNWNQRRIFYDYSGIKGSKKKAWQGAKAFAESRRDKDGLLSKEDAEAYAKMEQKIKDYSAEIERMEQIEILENELNEPVNTPILTNPQQTGGGESPNENTDAGTVVDNSKIDFTVRYCKSVFAVDFIGYRVVYDGEVYNILGVDRKNFKKRSIKLKCQKVRR